MSSSTRTDVVQDRRFDAPRNEFQRHLALISDTNNYGPANRCFLFESNLESNRPSDSFSNRIFESNRPYIPRKP